MPRPRKAWGAVQLSPGQASFVIDRLVSERRISAGEINRYVSEMHREIADLEEKLASLKQAVGGGGGRARRAAAAPAAAKRGGAAKAKRGRRRRSAITPEQLASRQLQGRYLGLIRQIPGNKRAPFQRTAKEKGREAAIKEMMTALKK